MPSARPVSKSRRLVVILGPTASGKSALGVRLARRHHGVVISADSRQVYRGLNIGTGKISRPEMHGVRHLMLNVASPKSQYSVSHFVRDTLRAVQRIPVSTPLFLVGGSPFYIDALTKPGSFSAVPPNPKLRRRLAAVSIAGLMLRLRRLDPARARTIDPANRRRLIRAIEVASGGIPPGGIRLPQWNMLKIGIRLPRRRIFHQIDRRVDRRIRRGMITEIRGLHGQGLSWKRLDSFGLEYRYLSRHLRGQLTRAEAISQLKFATHDFARRQLTWWKRDHNIHWVTIPAQAERLVNQFLA